MFSVATTFDSAYFKWGYALICSVLLHYPTEIFVQSFNLTKGQSKSLKKLGVQVVNGLAVKRDDDPLQYYIGKIQSIQLGFSCMKNDCLVFMDADSLLDATLVDVDKQFKNYDFSVLHREGAKEHLSFLAGNILLRSNKSTHNLVQDWLDMIPGWTTPFPISRAYAEQACLYLSYIKHKEHLRFINASNLSLPIFHAKGSKHPKHKDYQQARYQERCDKVVAEYLGRLA